MTGGAYELVHFTAALLRRSVELDEHYGDLGLGLADASVIAIAEELRTRDLLTLDQRHFRAVESRVGALRLLPADAA